MTLDHSRVFPEFVASDEAVSGMVYHSGYPGVRHERTVMVYDDERWVVEDRLISKETHTYRLHWLLPDWEWELESREQRLELSLLSPYRRMILVLQSNILLSSPKSLFSIVRAGEIVYSTRDVQPFEGWVSPTYGKNPGAFAGFRSTICSIYTIHIGV
jgi:hypothetical protein